MTYKIDIKLQSDLQNRAGTCDRNDRYASLALIETIRLYLSFLSGNSVNLFCLRFTLQIASSGIV